VARLTLPRPLALMLAILTVACAQVAIAAVSVHIVRTDLKPLIRAGYQSPVQFAVLVPHAVSTATGGKWSIEGERAVWRYAVEVPTAVSMSFHATRSSLPDSALLVVEGAKTSTSYRARDLHRGELWSRIHPGAALQFTLTVAAADRSKIALNIVSLQAGYRSLGPGVEDHPYYRQLKAQERPAQASGNAACVTNYECEVTSANTPLGFATVALVIGDLYQCTGTLINDVPGDNTPYLLSARHCETGQLGGGNPGAASTVTVYWDATTPCGTTLASIYEPTILTQTGAQTIVEQQDAWLIALDVGPLASDAQFAGFDASGGAVQGGYTIHHAEGYDKQFAGWYGQAYAVQESNVNGTRYVSDFLETVNQLGNVGPGASGSALIDQNNRLVGSLTGGPQTSDPSGYGACPVTPLTAPNGSNGVAYFTSLAAVWSSTADTTSTTGSATLKSVLDPANTGTLVVPSAPVAFVTFSPSTYAITIGESLTLNWSASGATQCTAGGGISGDGWSGTLAASGSLALTETTATTATYTLTCSYPGSRTAKASTVVSWLSPIPVVQLNAPVIVWAATPATISWTSNAGPCSISGGGLSESNLPSSGSVTTTQAVPAEVTYTVTCGPPGGQGGSGATIQYVTPSLIFFANGTDRLLGQTFFLEWGSAADTCIPSGGAPNDGWGLTQFSAAQSGVPFHPNVTTLGTYTYTLTCTSGSISIPQSVTVTFENNAPYVAASLSGSSVTYSASPADYVTLTYNSNLSVCQFSATPSTILLGNIGDTGYPQGVLTVEPYLPGSYQLVMDCFTSTDQETPAATSTPMTLTVLPPPPPTAAISFSPATVVAGESFTAFWSSANTSGCTLSGGIPGQSWGGSTDTVTPPTGSVPETGELGSFVFSLSCPSIVQSMGSASTQVTLTIGPLSATLKASETSVASGQSFTLTWSSVGATSCNAESGGANGTVWSGPIGTSGSTMQTATVAGTWSYIINCSAGNAMTSSQVDITVSAPSSSGGGGGGHGGGGGLGLLELGSLAALLALGRTRGIPVLSRSCSARRPARSATAIRAGSWLVIFQLRRHAGPRFPFVLR
jgi:lysyl endopeptidase